jgi:hypothetical protein
VEIFIAAVWSLGPQQGTLFCNCCRGNRETPVLYVEHSLLQFTALGVAYARVSTAWTSLASTASLFLRLQNDLSSTSIFHHPSINPSSRIIKVIVLKLSPSILFGLVTSKTYRRFARFRQSNTQWPLSLQTPVQTTIRV